MNAPSSANKGGVSRLKAQIERLAEFLDGIGKPASPITTTSSRAYLMRAGIRAQKRGGPLMVGDHEVTYRVKAES